MSNRIRLAFGLAVLVALGWACGAGDPGPFAPSASTGSSGSSGSRASLAGTGEGHMQAAAAGDDEWIHNPKELPPGTIGESNCTFAFALGGDPEYHPQDANDPLQSSCWERAVGHQEEFGDVLYRQQFQAVHVASAPLCGGGAGDLEGIASDTGERQSGYRICRVGGRGLATPCGSTGPAGCAANPPCNVRVVCH